MGEYVHIEGRYGKALIKVLVLFFGAPIHVFQMDEDCRVVAITLCVRLSLRSSGYGIANGVTLAKC